MKKKELERLCHEAEIRVSEFVGLISQEIRARLEPGQDLTVTSCTTFQVKQDAPAQTDVTVKLNLVQDYGKKWVIDDRELTEAEWKRLFALPLSEYNIHILTYFKDNGNVPIKTRKFYSITGVPEYRRFNTALRKLGVPFAVRSVSGNKKKMSSHTVKIFPLK